MALTIESLGAALRLTDGGDVPEPLGGILERLLAVSSEIIAAYGGEPPEPVKEEAQIRISAYLYDAPDAPRGDAYSSIVRYSGAGSLLWRYRPVGVVTL